MIHKNTSIGAITLKVADLDKMVAFYQDVMGLQVLEHSSESQISTLGTATRPLLHLRHLANGRRDNRQSGLYHLALRVSSRTALANWFRHYAEMDAPGWEGASDHGASNALYLSDPEGNGVEVYYDRPREQWQYDANGTIMLVTQQLDLKALLGEADNSTFIMIDPATDMGHIHLRASETASAKKFYLELLGFDLQFEMPNSALFMSAGGYHHHVGLNTWQSKGGAPNSDESFGLERFEICFDSTEHRQDTIDRLITHNYSVDTGHEIPTLFDPFQNRIALTLQNS